MGEELAIGPGTTPGHELFYGNGRRAASSTAQ
jgi:hypothetical protein